MIQKINIQKSTGKTTSKPNKIVAQSLNPPSTIEDAISGEVSQFLINFVENGRYRSLPCTQKVFAKIELGKMDMIIGKEFYIDIDPVEQIVTGVSVVEKLSQGIMNIEDETISSTKNKYMIFQKNTENKPFESKVAPESISELDKALVLNDLNNPQEPLKIADIVGENYIISDIRRNGTIVYVEKLNS